MPNLARLFREEISRLSRKELRGHIKPLRDATTRYRRDIARLKRETSGLQSVLARLERRAGDGAGTPGPEGDLGALRFSAKGVRAHRARLGVSAAEFGKLVGVSGHTVYKWEKGAARPREARLAKLVALRGVGRREAATRLDALGAKPSPRGRTSR